jgi:hypothetical protein
MDVLFPKIGEIIGGSQREDNYEKLKARAKEMEVPDKDICGISKHVNLAMLLIRDSDSVLNDFFFLLPVCPTYAM